MRPLIVLEKKYVGLSRLGCEKPQLGARFYKIIEKHNRSAKTGQQHPQLTVEESGAGTVPEQDPSGGRPVDCRVRNLEAVDHQIDLAAFCGPVIWRRRLASHRVVYTVAIGYHGDVPDNHAQRLYLLNRGFHFQACQVRHEMGLGPAPETEQQVDAHAPVGQGAGRRLLGPPPADCGGGRRIKPTAGLADLCAEALNPRGGG